MSVIRRTKSVKYILKVFEEGHEAISVVELVQQLHNEMNKTTVYRILERLENGGIVHSFMDKHGLKWYAKCSECIEGHHTDKHPHFQCNDCGKIRCIELEVSIPNLPNHNIESSELLLIGQCAECN